jgi:hypothetical protein
MMGDRRAICFYYHSRIISYPFWGVSCHLRSRKEGSGDEDGEEERRATSRRDDRPDRQSQEASTKRDD